MLKFNKNTILNSISCYNKLGDFMKLLVSDFDGTYFINEEDIVKNNEKIKEFRNNGNIFMLSSGRSFTSLKKMCIKYQIEYDYLSCCDGSILYDKNDNIIKKYDLNDNILKKFLNLQNLVQIEKIQYSYPDDYYHELKQGKLIGCNIVIGNDNITKEFINNYQNLAILYPDYDFLSYKHDDITYFCLKNKGINKSKTVYDIKDLLTLSSDDIYTIGDNENDYPMLLNFNGYYVGEAIEKIKKVSKRGYNQVYELLNDIEKVGIN